VDADSNPVVNQIPYEIEAIAALAPTLKEAGLRVLLELTRRRRAGETEVAAPAAAT
jgi:hypothetical protein